MTITLVGSSRELRNRNFLPPIDLLDLLAGSESVAPAETKTSAHDNSLQPRKVCMGRTFGDDTPFHRNFASVRCRFGYANVGSSFTGVLRLVEALVPNFAVCRNILKCVVPAQMPLQCKPTLCHTLTAAALLFSD